MSVTTGRRENSKGKEQKRSWKVTYKGDKEIRRVGIVRSGCSG